MSHIVYGTPQILDVLVVRGDDVAASRDRHYFQPPNYLTAEPGDTTLRTRNLQQTNVNGFRLQETDQARISAAHDLVRRYRLSEPCSPEMQALVQQLLSNYSYRLDTNFAKIDRIDNPEIERFKARVLAMSMRGRRIAQWTRLLRDLNAVEGTPEQVRAAEVLRQIYQSL